ncbi:PAS domain S-box-containing protein [Allopseudospirillum japonicum]|uniref:histidine kinase n=1 Tax=Allopseudospirillum japonicum TaxID=64971 RepID=A0A1H6RNP5_9GAMM|nr:PAS domain-containing protein [Allopseudospirillum japonicum]SEI52822.1 PAS domain S-box-containing protein [Allopseudospirillum japonicum]
MISTHLQGSVYKRQWAILMLGLLLVLGALLTNLYQERQASLHLAQERLSTQARIIDENLANQLFATRRVLNHIQLTFIEQAQEQQSLQLDPQTNHQLTSLVGLLPGVSNLLIFDREGDVIAASRSFLLYQNFAYRDYFDRARTLKKHQLHLSAPFITITKEFTMVLIQAVHNQAGEFIGAIAASLSPAYFDTLLNSVRYAQDMWVALAHANGIQFMMVPFRANQAGRDLTHPSSFFARHMQSGRKDSFLMGRVYSTNERRLAMIHSISIPALNLDEHLVLAVTRDYNQVFLPWWNSVAWQLGGWCLLVLGSSLSLNHFQKRARETEAALAFSEERFQLAINASNDGIWDWDLLTQAMYFSPQWKAQLGYQDHELVNAFTTFESLLHPEDKVRVMAAMEACIQDEQQTYAIEFRLRHKQGHWCWILSRGRVFRDAQGLAYRMLGAHTEISALKQVEEQLQEERTLFMRGPVVVFKWQNESTWPVDYVSPNVVDLLGYSPEALMQAQPAYPHLIHPQDQARVNQEVASFVTQKREHFTQQYRLRHRLGHYIWIDDYTSIHKNAQGDVVGFSGYVMDTSVQREREQRLRENEERFELVLKGTRAGVWDWNITTGETFFNQRWAEIVGYTLEELAPISIETWMRLAHPDDLGMSNAKLEQHFRGELPFYDVNVRMRHKDGHWVWVQDRGQVVAWDRQGQPVRMAGTHIDISAQVQVESAFKEAHKLARALLDNNAAAIVLTTPEREIIQVNQRFCDLFGYASDELVGNTLKPLHINETAFANFVLFYQQVLQTQRASIEYEFLTRDGEHLWCAVTGSLLDAQNPQRGIIWTLLDISERRQMEEALKAAQGAAESASRAKGDFLANMSHEIRTPMNAILGLLSLLERTQLVAQQADYVYKTQAAARSLLGLLNDILDFSKVEAGKLELEYAPFRLDEVLRNLSVILNANTQNKALEVIFKIHPNVPKALIGDSLRLHQVLLNLSGNAIKFTQEGEVILEVQQLETLGDHRVLLHFRVQDTGIGIAEDKLEHIFTGFSQAESSTSRRFGGTGLGLAISRRLVELMGGQLQAQSVYGQGSVFSFTLPLDLDPKASVPQSISLPPLHVLIVDDNPCALSAQAMMAESLGWSVRTCASGQEALKLIGRHQFDLMILDWLMPDQDGWQTAASARELCQQQGRPCAPIVLLSAQDQERLYQKMQEAPNLVEASLQKPLTASMLLDTWMNISQPQNVATQVHTAQELALQGLRLLVVEDNPINQQVARELLIQEGAQVDLVSGGLAAVASLQKDPQAFDVVLMDIQMPDIDGYEATRRIRTELQLTDLPIIAMTANALPADRQAALDAGMQGHIAKPIDMQVVIQQLQPYLDTHRDEAQEVASERNQIAPVPISIDDIAGVDAEEIPVLDLDAALARLGGNLELLQQLCEIFVPHQRELIHELAMAIEKQDYRAMVLHAHSIKGGAATLGALQLSACAAQAETQARAQQELTSTHIHALQQHLDTLVQVLQQELSLRGVHTLIT